jgi:hypothetical protein
VSSESAERDSSNYDSLMSVHDLINALYDTGDTNAKVFLGILTPDGNNPRTKCSIRAVHGDAWRLPAVEIVGQPLSDEKPADGGAAVDETANQASTPGVPDLIEQIREQDDALDELVMAAEWAYMYRSERAFERLREALIGWREASGEPR